MASFSKNHALLSFHWTMTYVFLRKCTLFSVACILNWRFRHKAVQSKIIWNGASGNQFFRSKWDPFALTILNYSHGCGASWSPRHLVLWTIHPRCVRTLGDLFSKLFTLGCVCGTPLSPRCRLFPTIHPRRSGVVPSRFQRRIYSLPRRWNIPNLDGWGRHRQRQWQRQR